MVPLLTDMKLKDSETLKIYLGELGDVVESLVSEQEEAAGKLAGAKKVIISAPHQETLKKLNLDGQKQSSHVLYKRLAPMESIKCLNC